MMTLNGNSSYPLYLRKMTSLEIKQSVEEVKIALVPVGSIEQHSGHLPIDTDLATVEHLAEHGILAARQTTPNPVALIAPSMPFGGPEISMEAWPGTISLRPEIFMGAVFDIGSSLARTGFRYIVLLNGCYGNVPALILTTQKLKKANPGADFILLGSTWETPDAIAKVRTSESGGLGHACEVEASTSLIIDPEHVHLDKAKKEFIDHPSPEYSFDFDYVNPFYWPVPFEQLTKSGTMGDPTLASAEKGQIILNANIQRISRILQQILQINSSRSAVQSE